MHTRRDADVKSVGAVVELVLCVHTYLHTVSMPNSCTAQLHCGMSHRILLCIHTHCMNSYTPTYTRSLLDPPSTMSRHLPSQTGTHSAYSLAHAPPTSRYWPVKQHEVGGPKTQPGWWRALHSKYASEACSSKRKVATWNRLGWLMACDGDDGFASGPLICGVVHALPIASGFARAADAAL